MALKGKQQRFVEEYLIDLNATRAAIRAGYSEKTASAIGHENLRKPTIVEAIAEAQAKRSKRLEVTVDSISLEFTEDRKLAHKVKQPGAAVSATAHKAKLHGLMTAERPLVEIGSINIQIVFE